LQHHQKRYLIKIKFFILQFLLFCLFKRKTPYQATNNENSFEHLSKQIEELKETVKNYEDKMDKLDKIDFIYEYLLNKQKLSEQKQQFAKEIVI
jgi:actin-related protein